ncbi:methyltransferase domain-containing protein [Pseudonocardia zijingensis]|uniref:BON domain-containing protein n=1 Tax=Pseudonocardia zijingensis TaxID=153376 RepID=A0ABP3YVL0_9PSEU
MHPTGPLGTERRHRVDADLCRSVADTLTHDSRLAGLDLGAEVDGGVVHLRGSVERPADLATARRLLGRLAGVHAVWDRVRVAGRAPVALDIGAGGQAQYPENLGVDLRADRDVAVRADVSRPLPFADGCVDRIYAVHVLEHLIDYLGLVEECHRLLRPGGILHLMSPWWRHVNAVADPTHIRLLDLQTVKGICAYAPPGRRWRVLHAGCDGASVLADLTPLAQDEEDGAGDPLHLARFFD